MDKESIGNIPLDLDTLGVEALIGLKKLVAGINNTITTKLAVSFVRSSIVKKLIDDNEKIEDLVATVQKTDANINGYDIVYLGNIKDDPDANGIIAEVKSSIPVKGDKFGSKQIESIEYDIDALINGKKKKRTLFENEYGHLVLSDYYRFLVLLDNPDVKSAVKQLLENYNQKDTIEVWPPNSKLDRKKVYVVFVK